MTKTIISDARLTALWNRRSELNAAEWTELYGIVWEILHQRYKKPPFKMLSDELDDYVQVFFMDKVMRTAGNALEDREVSRNNLVGFFNNHLKDQLKKEKRQPDHLKNEANPSLDEDDAESPQHFGDGREFNFSPDEVEETLAHHHLTRGQLTDSARNFFDRLQEWQQQVLSHHLCSEGEYALPLSQLQERYPKTATYYKVKQLGIIHSLRTLPEDYEKTEIGRWFTKQLNLKLDLDNYALLLIALQVLCAVALQALDA